VKRGDLVRIQSTDGVGRNTTITLEDGTTLKWVRAATIHLSVGDVNTAELAIIAPAPDVKARVEKIIGQCPYCGHETELKEVKS
jgi:hypothetical protein